MLKRLCLILCPIISLSAFGDDHSPHEQWLGGFVELHEPDSDNIISTGTGAGLEFGYHFSPKWAGRFEYAKRIDESWLGNVYRIGADALYYPDSFNGAYLFGGLKHIEDVLTRQALDIGIGKHWPLTKHWSLITEAAAYQGLNESMLDAGLKVGLAYGFGSKQKMGKRYVKNPPPPVNIVKEPVVVEVKDSDGDGIEDGLDNCPSTPASDKVDSSGCSILKDETVTVQLKALFANNSSKVDNPDDVQFKEFAEFLKRHPNTNATIEGHTSAQGDAAYNQWLSEKRASSVRTLLIDNYGVPARRLSAIGYGESRLLDSGNTSQAHRLNRRIEAKVSVNKTTKISR